MKKTFLILSLAINSSLIFAQTPFNIEGTVLNNTESGMWEGVNIQRSVPTAFTYRNNSINSVNTSGYMLQAGDEGIGSTNSNLNGQILTGNKFVWNGTDMTIITHGVFTGYNINAVIKYNYLDKVPMGIIRKSNGMTDVSGVVAYNIIKNPNVGVVIKGMNGVKIYNNTFYNSRSTTQTYRGLIDIYANDSFSPAIPSTGTKIKNNIFYTKYQIVNISISESSDLSDFESDYNVFYCEAGTPMFKYLGAEKTFTQWQALGFDLHSVIVNPNFLNITDFVPAVRLDYGTSLGASLETGLSIDAIWGSTDPKTTNQNGKWQVGARIFDTGSINPYYISSVVENAAPAILEMTYSLSLANIVPGSSAFNVKVNSVARTVNTVAIVGAKVRLTLAIGVVYGDIITVEYVKPALNPLQTVSGGVAQSFNSQSVINNCKNTNIPNAPPVVIIKNEANSFSGFVGEIDATGTYDINKDILTYEWIVPNNVSISSTNASKIKFLSPVVDASMVIDFQLKVNDGKVIVSKSIQINIVAYKPDLDLARIINTTASSYLSVDYPKNASDGNIATKWSAVGDDQWFLLELDDPFKISHLEIAFLPDQKYNSYFDILASKDNLIWEPILINATSCNFSGDIQVFDFPLLKTDAGFSYIKLVGHGNSLNNLNNISELKIFGLRQQNPGQGDTRARNTIIYPNPARDSFNILIEETKLDPEIVRLIDSSGRIVFVDSFESNNKNFKIPGYLNNGAYVVSLESGNSILYTQKLIINK